MSEEGDLQIRFDDDGDIEEVEFKGEEYQDLDALELEFPEVKGVVQMAENIRRQVQPILKSVQPMFDWLDRMSEMMEGIAEWKKAHQAIEEDIQKFPHISDYDPEEVEISEEAVNVAETEVERFLYTMEEHQDSVPENVDYTDRLDQGLQAFRDENYLLATYVFMSVQDGLMSLICRMNEEPGKYYDIDQKSDNLAEDFTTLIGLESDEVKEKVKHFWSHRKAVMHGDAEAYYGEEVAKASLLFLHATISTMFQIDMDEEIED